MAQLDLRPIKKESGLDLQPIQQPEKGLLRQGLEVGGKTLDWPGGLVRAGIAQAGELGSDKNDIVTKDDWINALQGPFGKGATGSAEYLKRAGLDDGGSVDLPIVGKTSLRDAEGLGLDIATDPLNLIGKFAKPVAGLVEGAGKTMYKSGFKRIDERLAEEGAKPLSDVLYERNIGGSARSVKTKMNELGRDLGSQRKALFDETKQAGVSVNGEDAAQEALKMAKDLKKERLAEDLGQNMEDMVRSTYQPKTFSNKMNWENMTMEPERLPPMSLEEATRLKSRLRKELPKSAFNETGYVKDEADRITKTHASSLQQAIENAANAHRPGMGDEIANINRDWGSIIEAENPTKMQVRRETTPNLMTSVDAPLAVLTHGNPMAFVAKKGADLAKTTAARTYGGLALKAASQVPHLDDATRRALINILRTNNQ